MSKNSGALTEKFNEAGGFAPGPIHAEPERPLAQVIPFVPKRLAARLEYFKIDPPNFAAIYDRIFVYPLKGATETETEKATDTTAGGIVLPKMTTDVLSSQRGLLMSAGPKAVEQLYGHGISLGDIVVTARFSPYERTYLQKGKLYSMLVLRASEVLGSEDLANAYAAGDIWMEMSADGTVALASHEGGRKRTDPEDNIEGI